MKDTIKKQTILIVDDMPINIQVLAGAFKSLYNIKISTTGKKALEIAFSDNPPDVILLDIMMPEMDGYEVCKRLKEDARTQGIPVIFITAKGEVEDETLGLELGATDYITKPFHLPIVRARVKTQLALKQKTDLLENLAFLDGLTNIPNRRRFEEILEREWKRAKRMSIPLSMIMADIDCFKEYNDHYGHGAGDDCLKDVARKISEILQRPGDFVARVGGEEFAVILSETDNNGAYILAEKIRSGIESLNIQHAFSKVEGHITMSMGTATMVPSQDTTSDALYKSADKMLYEAKDGGRNQTIPRMV